MCFSLPRCSQRAIASMASSDTIPRMPIRGTSRRSRLRAPTRISPPGPQSSQTIRRGTRASFPPTRRTSPRVASPRATRLDRSSRQPLSMSGARWSLAMAATVPRSPNSTSCGRSLATARPSTRRASCARAHATTPCLRLKPRSASSLPAC
eukprot:Amastigsp_a18372_10.p2 type:complete len:151 gc:universal Amastigsp_a18372_10:587-135(-)